LTRSATPPLARRCRIRRRRATIQPLLPTRHAGKVACVWCQISNWTKYRAPAPERAHATGPRRVGSRCSPNMLGVPKVGIPPFFLLLLLLSRSFPLYFLTPILLPFAPVACCLHDLFCFRSPPCYSCCR
jgi:hypothetical protein